MNINNLTLIFSSIFIGLTGCAPLAATSVAASASAVVYSTAAPLPLLENITTVRYQPAYRHQFQSQTDCASRTGLQALKQKNQLTLKPNNQMGLEYNTTCKNLQLREEEGSFDLANIVPRSISLSDERTSAVVDFFNLRQYRWQKGLPKVYTTPVHQPIHGNELHFYKDTVLVFTVKVKGRTLEASFAKQDVHRELSQDEWKWLTERIPFRKIQVEQPQILAPHFFRNVNPV